MTPLLHFNIEVANTPATERIAAILLQTQIQIEAPQRSYDDAEKEKLSDLYGPPEAWGRSLRSQLLAQTQSTVRAFTGSTEAVLPVTCTYDLNVATAKYLYALRDGDVPLCFLFSGTVFYTAADGRLQVQQVSWESTCTYRMPVRLWQDMMDSHYPGSAWVPLQRDVFDRLYSYRRRHGILSWEEAIERLLSEQSF